MSALRLILASLMHHRRANVAVAGAVAVCTAVLTGALLVGDSMRGSLRQLALDRLGRVDEALVADHFFRAPLADELVAASKAAGREPVVAAPAILLRASLDAAGPQSSARANRVELVGCDERFWRLGNGGPLRPPGPREIVLNRTLAGRLGVREGDTVLLRLPRLSPIPAESALGRKRETVQTQRMTVGEIIVDEGLGSIGLRPAQRPPHNAFVPLDWLQDCLDEPGRVNAILVEGQTEGLAWNPLPADYGLRVERTPSGAWSITSDGMILDPATERAVLDAVAQEAATGGRAEASGATTDRGFVEPTLTYLANTLAVGEHDIPYSTVTALDFAERPPLGPFRSADGKPLAPLRPGEIALNTWAADQLHARPGDTVRLSYFEPESIDGEVREATVSLRLAAIVGLSGAAADRTLVPAVKGMTDELTMAQWDPPFPFDAGRIRPADEAYWHQYGPTPKAFVSLGTGRKLWGSRFGETTSIRVAGRKAEDGKRKAEGGNGFSLSAFRFRLSALSALGMTFQPVRQQALAASAGTTPFGVLFLCFSFFIIVAAVMLIGLLFRLGVERRANEIGTLTAVGFARRHVGRILLAEGSIVAAIGSAIGLPLGVGYAAFLLLGLRTWWLAAVAAPFLRLHVTATSLLIGGLAGLLAAVVAIAIAARRIACIPPRQLLAGQTTAVSIGAGAMNHRPRPWLEMVLILAAVAPAITLWLAPLDERLRAGAFFGAGALALASLLALVQRRLRAGATGAAVTVGRHNLARMALRNAARNPGRSALTVGMVAAATFLIVAVSAFHVDPGDPSRWRDGGTGGYALAAETDLPILQNPGTSIGRRGLGFSPDDNRRLDDCTIVSLRVRGGDDASCRNLYRPRQPRVLGVPDSFIKRDGFAWAEKPRSVDNPWQRLDAEGEGVPVVLEKNTANYALDLWNGIGETFEIDGGRGRPLRLRVAGLMAESIFQGDLLIGERDFLRRFPESAGYRFFLVASPPDEAANARAMLERNLGDFGFAAEATTERLARFLVVQNTYLSTFQSLGGLGLLLGALGVAAVQLRNIVERRGELALLQAVGFRRRTLATLVVLEHGVLLALGLGIGVAAAALAVLPQLATRAATLPWLALGATLAAAMLLGLAACGVAVRATLRTPLLAALREERA